MPYQDSYYLPERISRVVRGHHNHYQNPGLILDKYVPRIVIDDTKQKGPWLRTLCTEYAIDKELVQAIYQRWQAFLTAQNATRFDATLEWRMVVGLGGESVLETDITLHHLYGIPFIPGSALKGLTRTFAAEQKAYHVASEKLEAGLKPSLEETTDHPDIQRIFGTQERAGTVIFFDALPANGKYAFAVDIMNPHYPDYYGSLQGGAIKAPANNQSPNPITFLTIQNAIFTFALAVRDPQHQEDLLIAQQLLQQAIEQYGVGGKTSAGYGYFKKEDSPELKKAQVNPSERIRAKLPQFQSGQELKGSVIPLTDELRSRMPSDIKTVLRYESFPTAEALIALNAEEVENWKPGETRICIFEREVVHEGLTIWFCKPRAKKDKKK
ncbi:MAG TPA: type III-B CRISPR module RAMP protein Cmr6 [Ktedonosporobacter sp.]|jgi:CRISPR-associated protein Cmr6|nr:type III-B CRISPR module RAMP protein Cmr6 [Ktedonosporobacter sp.]